MTACPGIAAHRGVHITLYVGHACELCFCMPCLRPWSECHQPNGRVGWQTMHFQKSPERVLWPHGCCSLLLFAKGGTVRLPFPHPALSVGPPVVLQTWMSRASARSRRPCCSMTAVCWWLIPAAASPRSKCAYTLTTKNPWTAQVFMFGLLCTSICAVTLCATAWKKIGVLEDLGLTSRETAGSGVCKIAPVDLPGCLRICPSLHVLSAISWAAWRI